VFAGGTRRDIKGRGLSNYLGQRTFAKLIGWRIFLLGKPGRIRPQSFASLQPRGGATKRSSKTALLLHYFMLEYLQ
jgi:hypothetical protein